MAVSILVPGSFGSEASNVAAAVDRKYTALNSLKADFTQTYSGAGRVRKESGTLWLRQPGKMRWDYHAPQEKVLVADGKTAYFYVPGEKQARRAPLKKLDDVRSPLRFLLGKARLAKELDRLEIVSGESPLHPGNTLLRGVPKRLADRVDHVLIEVNPQNQIERLVIAEVDGATTEFQFTSIVENPTTPANAFRFDVPKGVEVVAVTELAD